MGFLVGHSGHKPLILKGFGWVLGGSFPHWFVVITIKVIHHLTLFNNLAIVFSQIRCIFTSEIGQVAIQIKQN
jgi:hypothetical protein